MTARDLNTGDFDGLIYRHRGQCRLRDLAPNHTSTPPEREWDGVSGLKDFLILVTVAVIVLAAWGSVYFFFKG